MPSMDQAQRLADAAKAARDAEALGDDVTAAREWRRFRLIEDAGRDPEELLAEGIALSVAAQALIEPAS
jgi:negative regulator of sigma E activity